MCKTKPNRTALAFSNLATRKTRSHLSLSSQPILAAPNKLSTKLLSGNNVNGELT
jgi:hypothetical protein